jgi:hypothetical protein
MGELTPDSFGTSTIAVRVGMSGGGMDRCQEFIVHEDLIRNESPFFEAAMGRD